MSPRFAVAAAAAVATLASGELVTSLPGLRSMPPWKTYAGYVPYTSPLLKSTHYTFHWIVESQGNPATDPILFWTNGGPGCSGLYGMGFEHGPFVVQGDGGVVLNELSWNKHATVVYFEQPAGVGFSYSSNPADYNAYNDTVAATDNAAFLTAFFAMYPQYQDLRLFLTSESYGGNYIPQLAALVLSGADTRLAAQLRTGGFAVGNPVFSAGNLSFAAIMQVVTPTILFGHSLIPLGFSNAYDAAGCNTPAPPAACGALTDEMFALAGTCWGGNNFETNACGDNMYSSPYGNATLGPDTMPSPDTDALWNDWLNRDDVQAAIHAKKPRAPHADCSDIGYDVTWPSSLPDYAAAFDAGLKVLIFSGDVDVTTCPFASTQLAVLELQAAFPAAGAITANWTAWAVPSLPFNQTAGYIEAHRAFTFATVKAGGHEAPAYVPLSSFALINAFISGTLDALTVRPPPRAPGGAPPGGRPTLPRTQSGILRDLVRKSQRGERATTRS